MQVELRIADLPLDALAAASVFHSKWLEQIEASLGGTGDAAAIVMPPASYNHTDWRRAAARDLARKFAPARVNIVAGSDEGKVASTLAYLAGASGVTGQYLITDGNSDSDELD